MEYVVLDLTLQGGVLLRPGMPLTSENATRSPSSKPSRSSSTQLIVVVAPLAVTPAIMPLWGCSPVLSAPHDYTYLSTQDPRVQGEDEENKPSRGQSYEGLDA